MAFVGHRTVYLLTFALLLALPVGSWAQEQGAEPKPEADAPAPASEEQQSSEPASEDNEQAGDSQPRDYRAIIETEDQLQEVGEDFINEERFEREENWDDWFEGTLIGTRYRAQRTFDIITHNRLQYQFKFKGHYHFSDVWSVHFQPQTGDDFWSSGWDDLVAVSDDSDAELEMRFRRLFFQGVKGKFQWQFGSLPSRPKGTKSTPLNVDTDGWIDGGRFLYQPRTFPLDQISVTLGSLDTTHGNFWDRSWDIDEDPFAQVQLIGRISKQLTYLAEFNRADEDDYFRGHINWDLKRLTGLVATYLVLEGVVGHNLEDDEENRALSIGLLKEGKRWRAQLSYVENDLNLGVRRLVNGPVRRSGNQVFAMHEYQFGRHEQIRWTNRISFCVDNLSCRDDYRAESILRFKITPKAR